MFKAVLFDLDGTLLNTLEDLNASVNAALSACGYRAEQELMQTRSFVGNGVKKLIERSLPPHTEDEEIERVLAVFRAHYSKNMRNKTRPYDGIPELLAALKADGIKLAVVSNKFDAAVKALCAEMFPGIKTAIGEREGIRQKPAPDSVFAALEEMGAEKSEAIYIGDSDVDVLTAKNAGMKCIGVTWGFRDRDLLEKTGADFIANTTEEIYRIIIK